MMQFVYYENVFISLGKVTSSYTAFENERSL